jgi:membrane-associated protein
MSAWLPGLLTEIHTYGYLAVWLILFIAAVGVPLPVDLLLLAAGALSAGGHFNILLLALFAVSGSVGGDHLGYGIGRWWGHRLLTWLERSPHWHVLAERVIVPAQAYFAQRGGWAIFLSRCLVSGLGGEINLLAGADCYAYRRFVLADVTGETLGAVIPLSLGYVSGARWKEVGNEWGLASLGALAALLLLVLLVALAKTIARPGHLSGGTPGGHLAGQQPQQKARHILPWMEPASEEQRPGVSLQAQSPRGNPTEHLINNRSRPQNPAGC